MKFWEIFRFEVNYQFQRLSTWIYYIIVLLLFLMVIDEIADYSRTVERIFLNSPVTIADLAVYSTKFGLLLVAALAGNGAMRDIQSRMDPLIYTSSISKSTLLGGRFLATFFIASILILSIIPLGLIISSFTMGLDSSVMGPFSPWAYINAGLFIILPNIFLTTTFLYALVLVSRHSFSAYIGAVLFIIFSTFSLDIAGSWELGTILDPFGAAALNAFSRTLTLVQINTEPVLLEGFLLANRTFWIVLSIIVGLMSYFRFSFTHHSPRFRWRKSGSKKPIIQVDVQDSPIKTPSVLTSFNFKARVYQTLSLSSQYLKEILISPAGLAFPAMGFFSAVMISLLNRGPLNYPILPITERVTFLMDHLAFEIIGVMVITLVAGYLIWRDRDARLDEISDALPIPNIVMIVSKWICMIGIIAVLQSALMFAGIAIQFMQGYNQFEITTYLQVLFGYQMTDYLLFGAVAMAIHIIVNQKYIGYTLVLTFYLLTVMSSKFGIHHKLLIFGSDIGLANSIFYDQSAFLFPWFLFKLYWIGWALFMMIFAKQMWIRGRKTDFRKRLHHAFLNVKSSPALVASFMLIVSMGAVIFYNTNILNKYIPVKERVEKQLSYETLYGNYEDIPQPHLTATHLNIEFYPDRREAVVQGNYQLKNSSGENIDSIHLDLSDEVETREIRFDRSAVAELIDEELGYSIFTLSQPLLPGDSLQVHYILEYKSQGFSNRGIDHSVINNGTYFESWEWLPKVGYQRQREISNPVMRQELGLPERSQISSLTDQNALENRSGNERIEFKATIGTTAGQVAVTPGVQTKTWSENGRAYFEYEAKNPILNMYHIYSANYGVHQAQWNDVDIRIFHHPQNRLNLNRFEKAIKTSLDYYSKNFSDYPFGEFKFVEYSDPGTAGISLPGTIGYSTNLGLLNPEKENRGFDLPFAVAAHEIAHQWWPHQLITADVEGAPLITEGLAWYSAMEVVEQEHGSEHLQNLLDAMRMDFLTPRTRADVPLLKSINQFHGFRKGPFAMYGLREYIGNEQVNKALQNLLNTFKSGEPPYATSLDFYSEIQDVTPDSLHYLLSDLFEANTYWELETKNATMKQAEDSSWIITLEVLAQKVQVNEESEETEIPMNDWIEIGLYGNNDEGGDTTIYLKKHRIKSGYNQIVVKVTEKPARGGIDPRSLLIDTNWINNSKRIVIEN